MKKILHITRDAFYGQYQVAKKIVENTNNLYENKLFCYTNLIEKNSIDDHQLNFKVNRVLDEEIITPQILFAIKKEAYKSDILFYHNQFNYSSLVLAIYLKIFSNKKSISLFHSNIDYNEKGGIIRDFYFRFRELIIINILTLILDKLIFITESQKNNSLKYCLIKKIFKKKSQVINNFIEKKIILKNKSNIKNKSLNILFVGRYTKEKGFFDLINLACEMKNVNFNFMGGIIIDSNYKNVCNIGIVNNEDIYNFYDKSSIFILPSYSETFGLVIFEAMARGLVILASDLPEIRSYFVDGRNGYLFPPGDIKKMKEIILYLKNNPKEIERISKNNLKDIHKFTEDNQITKYLKVYENVLKENSNNKIKNNNL